MILFRRKRPLSNNEYEQHNHISSKISSFDTDFPIIFRELPPTMTSDP